MYDDWSATTEGRVTRDPSVKRGTTSNGTWRRPEPAHRLDPIEQLRNAKSWTVMELSENRAQQDGLVRELIGLNALDPDEHHPEPYEDREL